MTEIVWNFDTSMEGKPVQYLYWSFLIIGLIGVAWPVGTALTVDDWCAEKSYSSEDDDCPELTGQINRGSTPFSVALGGGIIIAAVFLGIGGAFAIRCTSARKWYNEKKSSPCRSVQQTGRHSYDLKDVKFEHTTKVDEYQRTNYIFESIPIKCEDCDHKREVSLSTTMHDDVY